MNFAILAALRTAAVLACVCIPPVSRAANSPSQSITLDSLSPLASAQQITSRLLTPVTQDRIAKFHEKVDFSFEEQTIRPNEEPFELFVPEPAADGKYGLLVYIWPGDDIQVPGEWWKVFSSRHMIYIAARRSGNAENIFDRRVPLALHGYEYVRSRYPLDPERIFIGGFSGGSRTAQRVVMAYPDVFRGVFLAGGSDSLGGSSGFTLPSAGLTRELQAHTRFVFSTGNDDFVNLTKDARTRKNLEALCMQGVRLVPQPRVDHWVPDGRGLARVLNELERPLSSDEEDPVACNAGLRRSIDSDLARVSEKIADGALEEASDLLSLADAKYGGLAAPKSVLLAQAIAEKAGLYRIP